MIQVDEEKKCTEIVFKTFFYENINPKFPEGFDKDDFIESE